VLEARSLPARAPPMHYRDNLRRGHFWTPTGGQNSTPIDKQERDGNSIAMDRED
jgi:hypothetical protein